jgi:hypothetical protein
MSEKLIEIKRKLQNEILENESNENHVFDEYLTTDDIQWLIDKIEQLDNICLKTHQSATDRINELEKDIQFFKNRQKFNNIVTQELVELNDPRIISILTKTRIVNL